MGKKYIEVKLTSKMGHELLQLEPAKAVSELRHIAASEGKFIFLDGNYTRSEDLTVDMLENAEDVSVTNRLKGGK